SRLYFQKLALKALSFPINLSNTSNALGPTSLSTQNLSKKMQWTVRALLCNRVNSIGLLAIKLARSAYNVEIIPTFIKAAPLVRPLVRISLSRPIDGTRHII